MRTRNWRRYQRDLRITRSIARMSRPLEWFADSWADVAKNEGKHILHVCNFCQDCKNNGCYWCWRKAITWSLKYEEKIDRAEFLDYELNGLF